METDENSESASNLPAAETGKERETKIKKKIYKKCTSVKPFSSSTLNRINSSTAVMGYGA